MPELYHYNKNHDKLGRFTFSRLSGGLSSKKAKNINSLSNDKKKLYKKLNGDPYDTNTVGNYYGLGDSLEEMRPLAKEYHDANRDYIQKLNEFRNGDYKSDLKMQKAINETINKHVDDEELKELIIMDLNDNGIGAIRGTNIGVFAEDTYVNSNYPQVSERFRKAYTEYNKKCQQIANNVLDKVGRDVVDLRIDLVNSERDDASKLGYKSVDDALDSIGHDVWRYYEENLK